MIPSQFPAPWPPSGGQRRQSYLYEAAPGAHVPGSPVRVSPTAVPPEIVGSPGLCVRADPRPGRSNPTTIAPSAARGSPRRSTRLERTWLASAVIVNLLGDAVENANCLEIGRSRLATLLRERPGAVRRKHRHRHRRDREEVCPDLPHLRGAHEEQDEQARR